MGEVAALPLSGARELSEYLAAPSESGCCYLTCHFTAEQAESLSDADIADATEAGLEVMEFEDVYAEGDLLLVLTLTTGQPYGPALRRTVAGWLNNLSCQPQVGGKVDAVFEHKATTPGMLM